MKILVCGSRSWQDQAFIQRILAEYPIDALVIEGEADGADKLSRRAAEALGMPVQPMPANWKLYGKSAGFKRNLAMLDLQPDVVLAFWDGESKGTAHTIANAKKRGFEVRVFLASDATDERSKWED